jgi:hypothetical protein
MNCSTIEGIIRQSTNNPLLVKKSSKRKINTNMPVQYSSNDPQPPTQLWQRLLRECNFNINVAWGRWLKINQRVK